MTVNAPYIKKREKGTARLASEEFDEHEREAKIIEQDYDNRLKELVLGDKETSDSFKLRYLYLVQEKLEAQSALIRLTQRRMMPGAKDTTKSSGEQARTNEITVNDLNKGAACSDNDSSEVQKELRRLRNVIDDLKDEMNWLSSAQRRTKSIEDLRVKREVIR